MDDVQNDLAIKIFDAVISNDLEILKNLSSEDLQTRLSFSKLLMYSYICNKLPNYITLVYILCYRGKMSCYKRTMLMYVRGKVRAKCIHVDQG